jgi:hypothetical protein
MRRSMTLPARMLAVTGVVLTVSALGVTSAAAARGVPAATGAAPVVAAAACQDNDARAAADAYLDALVSHDASGVPFAPDVRRVENGLVTGRSADEIRKDLDTSLKYKIITALRDRSYRQDAPAPDGTVSLHVNYLLDVGFPKFNLLTAKVAERFDVRCGQLTYIEATIGL